MPGFEDSLKQVDNLLTRLPQLKKEQIAQAQNELRKHVQDIETERNNLLNTINEHKASIADLQRQSEQLKQANADLLRQIDDLMKRPPGVSAAPAFVSPLQLATSFRNVVDQIQADARKTPGVATTIKSMDIEIKGLVQVQEGKDTVFALPTAEARIDPNALSTLRVSFGAIPVAAEAGQGVGPHSGPTPTVASEPPNK